MLGNKMFNKEERGITSPNLQNIHVILSELLLVKQELTNILHIYPNRYMLKLYQLSITVVYLL